MRMRIVALSLSLLAVTACGPADETPDASPLGTQESRVTITVEDQVVARLAGTTGASYGYGEYLPPGYLTATTTKYPVIIHLNGGGEFGTASTASALLDLVTRHGALKKIRYTSAGKTYFGTRKVMVFTPQAATAWVPSELNAFIDFLVANYRVDTKRIYVTGLSAGGHGSWAFAYEYGSRLAALAPMASNIGAPGPTITQLQDVPVWGVHSYADPTPLGVDVSWLVGVTKLYGQGGAVSVSQPSQSTTYLFSASTQAWTSQSGVITTGSSIARLTVYPGSAHDCWTAMYDNYGFWDWMLAQQRP